MHLTSDERISQLNSRDHIRLCNEKNFLPNKVTIAILHLVSASLDAYCPGLMSAGHAPPSATFTLPVHVCAATTNNAINSATDV